MPKSESAASAELPATLHVSAAFLQRRLGLVSTQTQLGGGGREEGGGEKGGGEKRERASIQFSSFPPQTPDIDRSEVRGSSITRSSGGEECIVRPIVHLSPDYRGQAVKPSGPQRETGESQER